MRAPRCGSIVTAMTDIPIDRPARPLYRDPGDRVIAGVCAAMARYTGTDPVLWRVVTVVLAVFGGSGLLLYVVAWLLLPKRQDDGAIRPSWLERRGHTLTPKAAVILAAIGVIVLGGVDSGQNAAAVAVVAVVAYLVYRERRDHPPVASPPVTSASTTAYGEVPGAAAWTPEPPAVRPHSRLGLITLSVAALVSGALSWAALSGVDALTPARILAAALLVVGAGLLVGTWYGRARWLMAVAVLLALALGGTVAADASGATLRGGVGERTWVVGEGRTDQGFHLGVGEATLDLTGLPPDGRHLVVRGDVGLGHLIVLVPSDVPIRLHATVRAGEILEFGDTVASGAHRFERTRSYGPGEDPRIEIEASVGTGQVEVRRG